MTCYELKMVDFIAFLLGEKEQPENWNDIFSEYVGLRENKSSVYLLRLMTEINYLQNKYKIIIESVRILAVKKVEDLVDILKSHGFRAAYDWNNPSTYSRDLKAVLSGAKRLLTQCQRKQEELETYQKKHSKDAERKDFYMWAVALGEHRGHRVDLEVTTVAEWCIMLNNYERYCEVQNAKHNNLIKK